MSKEGEQPFSTSDNRKIISRENTSDSTDLPNLPKDDPRKEQLIEAPETQEEIALEDHEIPVDKGAQKKSADNETSLEKQIAAVSMSEFREEEFALLKDANIIQNYDSSAVKPHLDESDENEGEDIPAITPMPQALSQAGVTVLYLIFKNSLIQHQRMQTMKRKLWMQIIH